MKKSKFLRRLLSIAISFTLIASAIGTGVFSAAAEETAETESGIYRLLQFDGKSRWSTDGMARKEGLTDVVAGKTLNRVSANYENELRAYFNCKTPEEAGFAVADVKSVAYYVKTDDNPLELAIEHFTEKLATETTPYEAKWGKLLGGFVYTVPLSGDSVKVAQIGNAGRGTVKIPANFEGYIVYDAETATTKTLLDEETTFGGHMEIYSPKLSAGQTFWYGELSANTLTAKEFIASVSASAVYQYPLVTGVSWGFKDNKVISIDESDPYNKIFTGLMPYERNGSGFDQIGFFNKGIEKDYGTSPADITAMSFYVKNPGGHGAVKLRPGTNNPWTFFQWTYWDYYNINTGTFTRSYGETIVVPEGFEGYVMLDVRQTVEGNPNSKYQTIFSGNTLWFHEGQDKKVGGLKISLGSITVWTGDYQNVKQAFANKSNTLSAPMNWGYGTQGGNSKLTDTVVSGISFDGDVRKYVVAEELSKGHSMFFHLGRGLTGTYPTTSDFIGDREAAVIWLKNAATNTLILSMFQNNPWSDFEISYRLFDTEKLTMSESKTGNMQIPAGFTGYAVISLNETKVTQGGVTKPWKQLIADGGSVTEPAINANITGHPVGDAYYIGRLTLVKSLNEFIESRIKVTLAGDANKDGLADIRDMVRLKKYAAGIAETSVYMPNISYGGNSDAAAAATLTSLKKQLMGAANEDVYVSDAVRTALIPEEPEEEDIRTAANDEVGSAIYHMSVGDWDKLYGESIAAETDFLNYYAGGDISDVRTIKERDGAAWIYVAGSALEEDSAARANLAKYVETLKAEKLWNTVAGFEFEEIAGTEEKVAKFANLSAWLNENYPEKRQFAVLAFNDIAVATPDAYKYVTDIAFDWYTPETTAEMREKLEEMKTNTGLTNAKYWFLPGVYTSSPSEAAANHALAQLNVCYELLAEQKPENRGGLYYYNWKTFTNDDGTSSAYGLDRLLQYDTFKPVADRILEVSGKLVNKMTFTVLNAGGVNISADGYSQKWFDFSAEFAEMRKNGTMPDFNTFSYYFKNNSAAAAQAQLWLNQAWYTLKGTAYAYDINTGKITPVSDQFSLPAGFEGYVCYDLNNCIITVSGEDKAATEMFKSTIYQALSYIGANLSVEVRDISLSTESFANVDSYFKSFINNIIVNDGTDGSKGSIWTPIKGTSSHGYNFVTVDGISPDGTAIKLEYTEEELEKRSHNGDSASECGIGLNYTPDKELLSQMQVLSYYVNLAEGDATNLKFSGLKSYKGFNNAPAYAYDLRTKTLTKYDGNISLTSFEGYIIIDLRNATLTSSATPWADYILANGISAFQFDLVAKSFVNRPLVIDSVIFSRDYTARLAEIMAK